MRRLALVMLAVALGAAPDRPRAEPGGDGDLVADRQCGARSLYVLIRLLGRDVEFAELAAMMPAPGPGGYSMRDLRDAARAHGLRLRGVRLGNDATGIDRPMILLVEDGGHGHFLVARPVGHTGDLVQVIDPSSSAAVVDLAALRESPGWTGFALIPPGRSRPIRWVVAGALAAAGAGVLRSARDRGRRPS